jgi:hypothetical protein
VGIVTPDTSDSAAAPGAVVPPGENTESVNTPAAPAVTKLLPVWVMFTSLTPWPSVAQGAVFGLAISGSRIVEDPSVTRAALALHPNGVVVGALLVVVAATAGLADKRAPSPTASQTAFVRADTEPIEKFSLG